MSTASRQQRADGRQLRRVRHGPLFMGYVTADQADERNRSRILNRKRILDAILLPGIGGKRLSADRRRVGDNDANSFTFGTERQPEAAPGPIPRLCAPLPPTRAVEDSSACGRW